ncbi:MAG: hypothetical protein ACOY3P_16080 [Planctomycetota bacterium]
MPDPVVRRTITVSHEPVEETVVGGTAPPLGARPRPGPMLVGIAFSVAVVALVFAAAFYLAKFLSVATIIVLTFVLAARWVSAATAALAVVCTLSTISLWTLSGATGQLAAITAAVSFFALGNIPGRQPLMETNAVRAAFYVSCAVAVWTGWDALVTSALTVLLYTFTSGDTRIPRFLLDRVGLMCLALSVAARLAYCMSVGMLPHEEWPFRLAAAAWLERGSDAAMNLLLGALPWWPLAALATLGGIRHGHYATPFWRLMGCWIIAALVNSSMAPQTAPAHLIPPMAIMAAAGWRRLWVWRRFGR